MVTGMIFSYTEERKRMEFRHFFTKKNDEKPEDLALLPYAREFDPVRHKNKLLTITRYEDNCTPCIVRKASAKGRWAVSESDYFPLEDEVMAGNISISTFNQNRRLNEPPQAQER
jgi:hypothetical protein